MLNLLSQQNESDPDRLRSMYAEAVKESAVLKRSSIVNQLYGGWRLALEVQKEPTERPDTILERSDN